MAVSYYATQAELEAVLFVAYSDSTRPTQTQIQAMLTQLSARLDGLKGVEEQNYDDSDSCPEWCKQAVLAAAQYRVERFNSGEDSDPVVEIEIMKKFFPANRTRPTVAFSQLTPQVGTNDEFEEWE